jgi:hypothetical protein
VHYWADARVLRADSYRYLPVFPHVGDLGSGPTLPTFRSTRARGSTCTPHDPTTKNTREIINGYRVVVNA